MAKPYSMDLRKLAVERVQAGESARKVASLLKVSASSVIKWGQRQRQTGSVAPGKMGGHRPHCLSGEPGDWLLERIAKDADVTLRGLEEELGKRGVKADHATIGRFLHRKKQSFKKNPSRLGAEPPESRPFSRKVARPSEENR